MYMLHVHMYNVLSYLQIPAIVIYRLLSYLHNVVEYVTSETVALKYCHWLSHR